MANSTGATSRFKARTKTADVVLALIRKLIHDQAMAIPYGDWVGSAQPSAAGLQDYREEWEDHQNTNR